MAWSSALHFCHPSDAEGRAATPQDPLSLLPPLLLRFSLERLSSPPTLLETQPVQNPCSRSSHQLPSSSSLWMSGASSLLALSKAPVEGRGLGWGATCCASGLETQVEGKEGVSGPFPHSQREKHKVLGWRDGRRYPQVGPQ